ncbi:hypothetical protein D9613_004536 [Agrocybe pediades]|uniref:T6SS Phospholipase effector Tle1-like catalytic domain-containing protein n=1 Tax=Agrocybe pediades TaxID=84607 RepID=A0A8H4QI90_9AGAR|nr:hypothetical protein D9613_004536 [Agrocybe pediades]
MGGYKFLMQNFNLDRIGDRISLFGKDVYFLCLRWRDAFLTNFALALQDFPEAHVGLLAKDNQEQIAFAYRMFSRGDWEGIIQCREFKKTFSIDVHIDFIGLWDTVGSIGFIRGDFKTLSTHVRCVRHALALDERRVRFEPTFFTLPTREELMMGLNWGEKAHTSKPKKKKGETTQTIEDKDYDPRKFDLEEVWFAGCHAGMKNLNDRSEIRLTMFHLSCNPDVGGGSVTNNTRNSLSRIPLRWMVRECFKAKTGILFYKDSFKNVGLDHAMLWPEVKARPPIAWDFSGAEPTPNSTYEWVYPDISDFVNEEDEDLADAQTLKKDMLSLENSRFWWILEFLPHRIRCPGTSDVVEDFWTRKLSINRKRGRFIPQQIQHGVKVHRTVKIRQQKLIERSGKKYEPKAILREGASVITVD